MRNREKAKQSKTGEKFCTKYISRKPQDKNIALFAYKNSRFREFRYFEKPPKAAVVFLSDIFSL